MKVIVISIIILLALIYFLFYTTMGLNVVIKTSAFLASSKVEIKNTKGTITHFTLSGVRYHNKQFDLSANQINLNWNLKFLQKIIFQVNSLQASGLIIAIHESKSSKSSNINFTNLWPIFSHIQLNKIEINESAISEKNIGDIRIHQLHFIKKRLQYYDVILTTNKGNLIGNIYADLDKKFKWEANLTGSHIFLPQFSTYIANVNLYSAGKIKNSIEELKFKINKLQAKFNGSPITGLINVRYDDERFIIQEARIAVQNTFITLFGDVGKKWNLFYQLKAPQLNKFTSAIRGELSSNGNITGSKNSPDLNLNFDLNYFRASSVKLNKASITISGKLFPLILLNANIHTSPLFIDDYEIKPIHGSVNMASSGTQVQGQFNLITNNNKISGDYDFPEFLNSFSFDQRFSSKMTLHIPEINKLIIKIPYAKNWRGKIVSNILLSGKVSQPNMDVSMNLQNGEVSIPKFNLKFKKINVSASSSHVKKIDWKGTAVTSTGNVAFNGSTNLNNSKLTVLANVIGKNIYLIDTKEYKIIASPKLAIYYGEGNLSLTGEVFIPYANIAPITLNNVVTLPSDVTFKYKNKFELSTLNLATKLKLILGNKIYISYQNLNTELAGSLVLIKKEKGQLTAIGKLYTNHGTYKAYGRTLNINYGRLIYLGNPINNPGLNIEALHEINAVGLEHAQWTKETNANFNSSNKIKVGVQVHGSLNQPIFSLISTPTMSQNDILSYLLFDAPASQLSAGNSLSLMNAALSMRHSQQGGMVDNIQNKLNLFGISVQTTEVYDPLNNTTRSASSVKIGKSLSKNLNISYQAGIFDHFSILSLRYKLNTYWFLQTQTSYLETATDVIYEIEK